MANFSFNTGIEADLDARFEPAHSLLAFVDDKKIIFHIIMLKSINPVKIVYLQNYY